jgi:hypothetical protein
VKGEEKAKYRKPCVLSKGKEIEVILDFGHVRL